MKKITLLTLLILTSFCFGFAFKSMTSTSSETKLKKVTGIGGIFFKCKDPKTLKAWYNTHLGLNTDEYGTNFVWYQGADSTKHGYTQWSPFKETTKYLGQREFMINYRVADLDALVKQLKIEGVTIDDTMQVVDYGKFIHILDGEGNKVELWEPVDAVYGKFPGGRTM